MVVSDKIGTLRHTSCVPWTVTCRYRIDDVRFCVHVGRILNLSTALSYSIVNQASGWKKLLYVLYC